MSDTNNPDLELVDLDNATDVMPEDFMESVFDDNRNKVDNENVETEGELESADTPAEEPEDEVEESVSEDVEDVPEDETEDTLDDEGEDETDEEVVDINDLDTNQVVRLADGTEVNIQQLVEGQMMQSDYTKKTQALAEERKDLEVMKQVLSEKSNEMMGEHESILKAWNEESMVAAEQFRLNPHSQEAKQRYDIAQVNTAAAQRQLDESESTRNNLRQESRTIQIQEADVYASEHIEGWSDSYAEDLMGYIREATGASNEELVPFINGRTLEIVDKAFKFDKGAKKASNKRTIAKKTGKSLRTNASKGKKAGRKTAATKQQEALDRYEKTGDFEDLNSIFPENFESNL